MYSQQQKTPSHEPGTGERGVLWRVWDDVRQGAAHPLNVGAPLPEGRAARFVHGVSLPWHVLRALLAETRTRRRYLRVSLVQAGIILALALLATSQTHTLLVRAGDHAKVELAPWLAYWTTLLSSLQLAQWAVIALSRDFHTHLAREASLLLGLPPEDEAFVPRVRLNLGWMRNKLVHRWRGLGVFAMGVPVLWLCKWLVPGGGVISPVLLSLWGAWWFVVFTAGKSALAWREEAPREPVFLRGWKAVTSWLGPLRAYGSLWTRVTRSVFSPIARVERGPWGFAGLALVRALAMLPLVKCFVRPLIPVAAAHLLLAGQGGSNPDP